jgi:hypothetical protein
MQMGMKIMSNIDIDTPIEQYAPKRDTSLNWVIVNPDDIDNMPMVLLHLGHDLSGMAVLTHETCEKDKCYLISPSEILRRATIEEIISDTPNYILKDEDNE